MPTITKAQPTTPVEPLDLASLTHLNAHPRLRPLIERRMQVRQQLSEIGEQVKLLQKNLRDLPAGDSFSLMTQQRTLSDRIADLERQGAALEGQLRPLGMDIEAAENAVRGEVVPLLTAASLGVFEALVAAMEQLHEAQRAYEDAAHRNRHLVQSPILPLGAVDLTLSYRVENSRRWLHKLQERPGVL